MSVALRDYAEAAGSEVIDALERLARRLRGRRVVHVNSTRVGGGVAEILARLVPLMKDLGMDAHWEVIEGTQEFYGVTKTFHNALQGVPSAPTDRGLAVYDEVNREAARNLGPSLQDAEFVFIHDPQPAAILRHLPGRRGHWVWRCHIDVSKPYRPVWKFLRPIVAPYEASVYSMAAFAQPLPHPQYIIAPSIDPLSDKNRPLEDSEVAAVAARHRLDPARPVILQVSRFDRFKDPIGVLQAYRIARRHLPIQLVLVGGTATDDPEGDAVLAEVRQAAGDDPDVHVMLLPPDAHREINALQRRATLVMQKSLKEGFGLTVTEALWKGKPVIGGRAGGIVLQVVDHHTGFLVDTPEGAAFRIRYLLNRPNAVAVMSEKGRAFVRDNFLLTRHLREYLTLMLALDADGAEQVEVT